MRTSIAKQYHLKPVIMPDLEERPFSLLEKVKNMIEKFLEDVNEANKSRKTISKMGQAEIDQFLIHSRVGRIGMSIDGYPYVVPVGYCYEKGEIFFHSCFSGLKMKSMARDSNVCFLVDESLSDSSMYKSVIVNGTVEIIDDEERMQPYLQSLIYKYRIPVGFDDYISRPGRSREKEMAVVRICVITPKEITSRKMVRI
jgi:nitroimidazol reductase NimA-like FMN-containing flavoprotein (pyridoxamine 5'-phosphate oxidase superfamily)